MILKIAHVIVLITDEKSYEDILIYDAAYKTPYSVKPLRLILIKQQIYHIRIENMIELNIKHISFWWKKWENVWKN